MNRVRVASVCSYERMDEIRFFIDSAFEMDADIASFLGNGDPARLVVVKPNWVQEAHEYKPDVWEPVITHPSVVLAAVETLADKMGGKGTICICDAPHTYASFEAIVARGDLKNSLKNIRSRWPDLKLELIDLRREVWILKEQVVIDRRPNPEDPRGYVRLDLGRDSLFYGHLGEGKYYGADYDTRVVNKHHRGEKQEYLLAGTPVKCDLFVNLSKMKTHKKTGITCCLKNLVGINGDKNWLPHHVEGSPKSQGDEFPDECFSHAVERQLKKIGRMMALRFPVVGTLAYRKMRNVGKCVLGDSENIIRNGNWYGNNTCWRMALDLNRAFLYGNSDGTLQEAFKPKRYLAVVDGIVGGEGSGPLCPDPVSSGVMICGTNPAVVDAVTCRLMDFNPERLAIVKHAFEPHRWPIADCRLDEILVDDERCGKEVSLSLLTPAIPRGFKPHFGWQILWSNE